MTATVPHLDGVVIVRCVKAALAICVAGEIFAQTTSRPDSPAKALRVRIAADSLDKTRPDPYIFERYSAKSPGQTDAQFLLENLGQIEVLDPANWPMRKVAPGEWGEYTRVMRGLEIFLKKAYSGARFSKAEQGDVAGVLRFIEPHIQYVDEKAAVFLRDKSYLGGLPG